MALLFFWLFVVPLAVVFFGGMAVVRLIKPNQPLDTLPFWRQALRVTVDPELDATPEEIAKLERDRAARAQAKQNQAVISAIYNAAATNRS